MNFPGRFFIPVAILMACGPAVLLPAAEIWVAPQGSDESAGTKTEPLASLTMALRKARELRRVNDASVAEGVHIILRGGVYRLNEPVMVRPEDSGTEKSPTIIEAAAGERPVLSGGVVLSGWKKVEDDMPGLPAAARGKAWSVEAPLFNGRILEFRQLWPGSAKATRARYPNGDAMERLITWERSKQEAGISSKGVKALKNLYGVEMFLHQQWETANLRLKSVQIENEQAKVTFHQPESRIQFEHPWPQPWMKPEDPGRNSAYYLVGAIEFLDQPGEWVQQLPGARIFYWPRADEDLSRGDITVPALETLVRMVGSIDRPVAHMEFRGISFAHTTWLRPSQLGHVPHQGGMLMTDAYKMTSKGTPDWRSLDNQAWIERPAAAVVVAGAHHTRFERCQFEHLAMSGLDYVAATHDDVVEGCIFRDIGGNGLQMGNYGDEGMEVHLPYGPSDPRVICSRERIANNLIVDTANEDWGCIGLGVGWAREVTIEHNEILHTSYTAISVGWGWTRTPGIAGKNQVLANRIHRFATRMADSAGIYILGAQPQSLVAANVIESPTMSEWVHDPKHWGYVYLDEGSSFTTVRDNWCPDEKFIKNANGPGNLWETNGPAVNEKTKTAAGLEPAYRDLMP